MARDLERLREAERRLWNSAGVAPAERFVRLPALGIDVRVLELGPADGPPVLFVHGATGGGPTWVELARRLDGFRCLLLDRPGNCLSDPLPEPPREIDEIERYADGLIPDVLDGLGLPSAHVVSTSFGGYFALRAAAASPTRIDRMVEFSWMIGAPMAKVPIAMRIVAIPVVGRLTTRMRPNERIVTMLLRQVGLGRALDTGRFSPEALAWFVALFRETNTLRNDIGATPRVITPIGGLNERVLLTPELLGSIRAPTHFVWGADDPNGGADVAREFVAEIPSATLDVLDGAGHAPWIDRPDEAADTVGRFLRAA